MIGQRYMPSLSGKIVKGFLANITEMIFFPFRLFDDDMMLYREWQIHVDTVNSKVHPVNHWLFFYVGLVRSSMQSQDQRNPVHH